MTAQFLAWYAARTPRERLTILIGGVVVVFGLLYLVAVPVTDALASAKARHANAVIALGETERRVEAIKRMASGPAVLDAPLDSLIRTRADAAGFALTDVTPQGANGVRISIATARPGALLAWIAELEQSGILVDTLGTTDNGDKTVAVTLTLKEQGR